MDILAIDAASFAARTAHVAASELYGLLLDANGAAIDHWYDDRAEKKSGEEIAEDVAAMADYVMRRMCSGETLFLRNQVEGSAAVGAFLDQPFERQQAYSLFATVMTSVGSTLLAEQVRAEHDLDLATRPDPAKIALEDTIFEPVEGLGTMRPEAVAAQQLIADHDQAVKVERRAKRKAAEAQRKSAKAGDAPKTDKGNPASPAPMSVGEAPLAPPINRGGRGRKKTGGAS